MAGIVEMHPNRNATVVVIVVKKILLPTSCIVSSTRSMISFRVSVRKYAPVMMKVSREEAEKTTVKYSVVRTRVQATELLIMPRQLTVQSNSKY